MRDKSSGFFQNDITGNPFVWMALALCTGLLLTAVYMPGLRNVLHIVPPTMKGWGVVMMMSLVPLAVGQIFKSMKRNKFS
jgi:Ca2+-transporting ATPase